MHLLATSREPLGIGGETIYRVPSLSLPGPGDIDRGGRVLRRGRAVRWTGPGRRAPACTLTSRRPRWWCRSAGSWTGCRWPSSWPPPGCARCRSTDLHGRLDQRFRLLTGGSRTALARQRTLRATVEWSYSLLNWAEQLLLGRLSVFAEGFDLDAAEAVCGFGDIEAFDVTDLLGSLVDKSLVGGRASRGSREPCATGCWRPSASSPPRSWP